MLGRQQLYIDVDVVGKLWEGSGLPKVTPSKAHSYAEPLFASLGAASVDSLDNSSYEEATVIHNLNKPIPRELLSRFSLVFDGGTLEHVFNFPVAIFNCLDMLTIGGHYVSITPANNQCGHGFYQFSPELFFSLFTPRFGFKVVSMLLAVDLPDRGIREWYTIADPNEVKTRVTLSNRFPTYLMTLAKKISDRPENDEFPFQSDYRNAWQTFDAIRTEEMSSFKKMYKKLVPEGIRNNLYRLARKTGPHETDVPALGHVNPEYFRRVAFKDLGVGTDENKSR